MNAFKMSIEVRKNKIGLSTLHQSLDLKSINNILTKILQL